MDKLFESPAFWIAVYTVLVLGRVPLSELLKVVREIANTISKESRQGVEVVKNTNERVFKTLESVLDICIEALGTLTSALQAQLKHVAQQLSNQNAILASRILGTLVSFAVLLVFLYADLALGFQAVETLFPGIVVPEPFQNIAVSLVAASVGTIFALGILFWDASGFSELTPVAQLKGLPKGVFIGFVVVTALLTLACVLLIALNRAVVVTDLVEIAKFDDVTRIEIHRLASLAHSAIVIPMLITTFMMFRGVFGLLLIYMVLIGALTLFFQLTRLLLRILKRLVLVPGVTDTLAIGLLFSITNLILIALGWILGLVLAGAAAFTTLVQALMNVITSPPIVVWNFILPIVKSLLSRKSTISTSESKKRSEKQIDDLVAQLERSKRRSDYDEEYQ